MRERKNSGIENNEDDENEESTDEEFLPFLADLHLYDV